MKELPENLKHYQINNFKDVIKYVELVKQKHADSGFLNNLLKNHFNDNQNSFSLQQHEWMYRTGLFNKGAIIGHLEKYLEKNELFSIKLMGEMLIDYGPNKTVQKLFDNAYSQGIMSGVELDKLPPRYQNVLLSKNLEAVVAEETTLCDKDFDITFAHKGIRANSWKKYIEYAHDNLYQVEKLVSFDNSLVDVMVRNGQELKGEHFDLISHYKPQLYLQYSHVLPEDKIVDFVSHNFDKMLPFIKTHHFTGDIKEPVSDICAFNFIKNPNVSDAKDYIEVFGENFMQKISGLYNYKPVLYERFDIDLTERLEISDNESGERYASQNFHTRHVSVNYLQNLILHNRQDMSSVVLENPDVFWAPVIEKINGIEYEKHPIDFAFENSDYNVIFDFASGYMDTFNKRQKIIVTQMYMKEFLGGKPENLSSIIPSLSQEEYKSAYDFMRTLQPSKISELDSLYVAVNLNNTLEQKDPSRKMKI